MVTIANRHLHDQIFADDDYKGFDFAVNEALSPLVTNWGFNMTFSQSANNRQIPKSKKSQMKDTCRNSLTSTLTRPNTSNIRRPRLVQPVVAQDTEKDVFIRKRRYYTKRKLMDDKQHHFTQQYLTDKKSQEDEQFISTLNSAIECRDLADDVDKYLTIHNDAEHGKMRRMHETWTDNVHFEIQKRINSRLEEIDSSELNARKNKEYAKFLDITNKKPSIFRDIIIESEYDPLEMNRQCIKIHTDKLADPLSRCLDRRAEETLTSDTQEKIPMGRETLEITQWASGKIEATPHGIFSKMMAEKPNKRKNKRGVTTLSLDQYEINKDPDILTAEMKMISRSGKFGVLDR